MLINSYKHHRNGGFEQGILQIMENEGLLKKQSDKNRLELLKSLPQNRTEIINSYDIISKEGNKCQKHS